ncbi:hypothetical protein Tco_0641743, partial [Tanacetum coccineum]
MVEVDAGVVVVVVGGGDVVVGGGGDVVVVGGGDACITIVGNNGDLIFSIMHRFRIIPSRINFKKLNFWLVDRQIIADAAME